MSVPETLTGWLDFIERQHPQSIAMGLERVAVVRDALGLKPDFPLIIVGGTNGKGSVCMMLDAILGHARYNTGTYTSPHLLRYNERVRIAGKESTDDELVRAFVAVESVRAACGVPLTYFEFGTLAAIWLFCEHRVDVGILEVGLGGRLDAVNAFDATVAVLTGIDIDHTEYLGETRNAIAFEKAQIFRKDRPAVCADPSPPAIVAEEAARIGADLLQIGRDFGYTATLQQWDYRGPGGDRRGLPHPALRGEFQLANASACIAALDALRARLPVAAADIRDGLVSVENPGRFQVYPGRPAVILDVAHNPHAAAALALNLVRMTGYRRTLAVFSMLKDKDVAGVVRALRGHIDHWLVAPLEGPRTMTAEALAQSLSDAGIDPSVVSMHENIAAAMADAYRQAVDDDRILAFGSFLTVTAAMHAVRARRNQ